MTNEKKKSRMDEIVKEFEKKELIDFSKESGMNKTVNDFEIERIESFIVHLKDNYNKEIKNLIMTNNDYVNSYNPELLNKKQKLYNEYMLKKLNWEKILIEYKIKVFKDNLKLNEFSGKEIKDYYVD